MTTAIFNDTWLDAEEMNRRFPDSFAKPSTDELSQITKQCHVKICNGYERFFVKITKITTKYLYGEVANTLIGGKPYNIGDTVKFKRQHVLLVKTDEQERQHQRNLVRVYEEMFARDPSLKELSFPDFLRRVNLKPWAAHVN